VHLVLTGRKVAELEAVAQECRAKGVQVVALAGDLNNKPFVRQLAQTAHDADVFVNNAGILNYAPILDMPVEECEQMFATNVIACYDISREVAQHMVARGGGHMIFITSGSARSVGMHAVVYAATKHAVSAFAKGFRLELKSANVRVTELPQAWSIPTCARASPTPMCSRLWRRGPTNPFRHKTWPMAWSMRCHAKRPTARI